MEWRTRDSVHEKLSKFDYLAKSDSFIEVTDWTNGEGYDVTINDKAPISLTRGEIDAIVFLASVLDNKIGKDNQCRLWGRLLCTTSMRRIIRKNRTAITSGGARTATPLGTRSPTTESRQASPRSLSRRGKRPQRRMAGTSTRCMGGTRNSPRRLTKSTSITRTGKTSTSDVSASPCPAMGKSLQKGCKGNW